jgi:diguanylate cyclase (GGDEF)-like protein
MSNYDAQALNRMIEQLLDDPQYKDHPLREPLSMLYQYATRQASRLERIMRISDGYQSMLLDANAEMRRASMHDPLTGIGNRGLLVERLSEESSRTSVKQSSYVLVMLAVDNFQTIIDTWGPEAGDRVLVEISRVMQMSIREDDLCGRWGGETFVVILPGTSLFDARSMVESIYANVQKLRIQMDEKEFAVMVSLGVVAHHLGEPYAQTLNRVDRALTEARRNDKNKCVVHVR